VQRLCLPLSSFLVSFKVFLQDFRHQKSNFIVLHYILFFFKKIGGKKSFLYKNCLITKCFILFLLYRVDEKVTIT